jgi:2'-5' RNA ligase
MKRLFIAIKVTPDEGFLIGFRELKRDLRHERIKWVEENNIHITLKFLGETDEKLVPAIAATLRNTAGDFARFSFSLTGTGIFGSRYDPRVVWCGIEPYKQLQDLMKRIHQDMGLHGFEPDRQNLVPHLTLGRIKFLQDKQLFQSVLEAHRDIQSDPVHAKEFILYESILKKEGPVYIDLERFRFR